MKQKLKDQRSYCCNAELEWEIWGCDKNPEALIPEPKDHGNEIEGTITCDDDYCHPFDEIVDEPTEEYIRTHECHSRCTKCGCLTGD